MSSVLLRDVVGVRGRFHRSVRLTQDWRERSDLSGYLLTPTARELATRITESLGEPSGTRAWSVTGPYGAGKSSFALFLADLLAHDPPNHPDGQELRGGLPINTEPLVPVLVVGQRTPIKPALLRALGEAIKPVEPFLAGEIFEAADEGHVTDERVVELLERAADAANEGGRGGLLVILDEFGKFLEYAALHPETEDLFIMQGLAEAAARSSTPILLVTLLHTAFVEYLGSSADDVQRAEWQKVQGRFADVAFQEPPEQLLRLIGTAIVRKMPGELERAYSEVVDRAMSSPSPLVGSPKLR